MTIEAMKQALDSLEQHGTPLLNHEDGYSASLTALRQAIAEAEKQEPVAYWNFNSGFSHCMIDQLNEAAKHNPAPLYTAPPQRKWVGLTEEEIKEMLDYGQYGRVPQYARNFVDAIEAKLREKNGC